MEVETEPSSLKQFSRFEPRLVHFHPGPGVLVAGAWVHCRAAPCLSAEPSTCPGAASLRAKEMQQQPGTLQKSHPRAAGSRHSSFWSMFLNTSFADCIICFFLMKKDFRSSAVDMGLLKKSEGQKPNINEEKHSYASLRQLIAYAEL